MDSFEKAAAFHGHICPGLALGVRVSDYALRELGQRSSDEELVAVVENDSCAVDAVQALTGCTFGKGNLIFKDYGKHVYTFIKRPGGVGGAPGGVGGAPGGEALRISVKWKSPEETDEEKDVWRRYAGGDRSPEVLEAVHKRKSRKIDAVLNAPDEELFSVTRTTLEPPLEARIFPSIRCALCGEKTMESRARVKDEKVVCIPCFERKAGKNKKEEK